MVIKHSITSYVTQPLEVEKIPFLWDIKDFGIISVSENQYKKGHNYEGSDCGGSVPKGIVEIPSLVSFRMGLIGHSRTEIGIEMNSMAPIKLFPFLICFYNSFNRNQTFHYN